MNRTGTGGGSHAARAAAPLCCKGSVPSGTWLGTGPGSPLPDHRPQLFVPPSGNAPVVYSVEVLASVTTVDCLLFEAIQYLGAGVAGALARRVGLRCTTSCSIRARADGHARRTPQSCRQTPSSQVSIMRHGKWVHDPQPHHDQRHRSGVSADLSAIAVDSRSLRNYAFDARDGPASPGGVGFCSEAKNDSMVALSPQAPTRPMNPRSPGSIGRPQLG